MDHTINPKKTGLALGALCGGWHLVWAILVALGLAQGLINFLLWTHMLSIPIAVNTFDLSVALLLVVAATIAGYVAGYLFALIWNKVQGPTALMAIQHNVPRAVQTPVQAPRAPFGGD